MATQPMTSEAIALTQKKMDMALDDIIKMSKRAATKAKKSRAPNKNPRAFNDAAKAKSSKLRDFMDSRASLRQGALARKRSKFLGNHFQLATEAARKVAAAPFRGKAFNRPRGSNLNRSRSGTQAGQRAANGGVTAKVCLSVCLLMLHLVSQWKKVFYE
ncbi:uncharacterized protein LOC116187441 isoform X2 [Punica granatum]|uniref:Uncharacterized protein LOC116187441 isoform X2 n=1 Tax=Punica granatum TaxID=22663 RepID=A0A6P8BPT8_PUNGR|nr:uncharacterized protein LOC116187441 isoform X2 [Punica granatum]